MSLVLAGWACFACMCNACANALWKAQFNAIPLKTGTVMGFLGSVFRMKILLGVVCYGASMVIFFYLLSNCRLSQVVPFLAMTYVFNMAVAAIFLHESVSMVQMLGVALIVGGIIVANQG